MNGGKKCAIPLFHAIVCKYRFLPTASAYSAHAEPDWPSLETWSSVNLRYPYRYFAYSLLSRFVYHRFSSVKPAQDYLTRFRLI